MTLTVQQQGVGAVDSGYLNSLLQGCENLAQLRAFVGITGMQVAVMGIAAPDDGGQGTFYWNVNATGDDNLNNIIPPGAASGGWTRLIEGGGSNAPVSCSATGTNAYALTPVPGSAVSAYVNYQMFLFVAPNTSTGAVTANIASLGALPVYSGGSQLGAGDITAGTLYVLAYVSTVPSLVVVSPSASPGSITNAQLAQMPAFTFKANDTNASATPQDVTETAATAMLNPMVGDTGSGGTKGLVPAPPAGSAASGWVLGADGTWGPVGVGQSYYQSGAITIVTGGTPQTLSHGLGVKPLRVQGYVRCTVATGPYAIGDEIPVNFYLDPDDRHGPGVWVNNNTTTLQYQFPSGVIYVINTGGTALAATSANFQFFVRAWPV